jgi:hypothetical protein
VWSLGVLKTNFVIEKKSGDFYSPAGIEWHFVFASELFPVSRVAKRRTSEPQNAKYLSEILWAFRAQFGELPARILKNRQKYPIFTVLAEDKERAYALHTRTAYAAFSLRVRTSELPAHATHTSRRCSAFCFSAITRDTHSL